MHPAFDAEQRIRSYLDRKLDLENLSEWFVATKGALLALPAEMTAARLTTILELGLIELREGDLSERQLRKLLREEVENTSHFVVGGNPDLTLSAAVTTIEVKSFDSESRPSSTGYPAIQVDISA